MKTYEEICNYLETEMIATDDSFLPFERDVNYYYYVRILKIRQFSKNESACLLSFKEMLRNDLRLSDFSKATKIILNLRNCVHFGYGMGKIPSLNNQIKKIFIYAFAEPRE